MPSFATAPFLFPRNNHLIVRCRLTIFTACLMLASQPTFSHGGVVLEEDQCVIRIGFLKAHFTGYQPKESGNEEFCEDIPEVARSVFVLDYLHEFMKEMPIDFRIIEDVNNFGLYAKWSDIVELGDIESDTVFYQSASKHADGVLTVDYRFEAAGNYIGIVTARHPTEDKIYNAVFPFQVGNSGSSYTPLFIGFIVLTQVLYWLTSGGMKRRRRSAI